MSDIIIGAAIVLITLFVEETIRYFYSIRVEREKAKIKQEEDARNFRLNSIKEMKEELIEVRFDLAKFFVESSNPIIRGSDLLNSILRLYKMKANLYTYSGTKDLAVVMDELGEELFNFEKVAVLERDPNKLAELHKKLVVKIEELLKIAL